VGSLLRERIPKCAAVTALGECVNYAFDAGNNDAALKRLFRRVHDALQPGGLFIFDAAEPGVASAAPGRRWMDGKDWAILLEITEQPRARTAQRRMTIFRRVNRVYRRSEEVHPLRLYRRETIARLLKQAGFQVEVVEAYGKVPFRKALAGYVCRK
jgi:hypothetical protein